MFGFTRVRLYRGKYPSAVFEPLLIDRRSRPEFDVERKIVLVSKREYFARCGIISAATNTAHQHGAEPRMRYDILIALADNNARSYFDLAGSKSSNRVHRGEFNRHDASSRQRRKPSKPPSRRNRCTPSLRYASEIALPSVRCHLQTAR
jgi:hypothetical protein